MSSVFCSVLDQLLLLVPAAGFECSFRADRHVGLFVKLVSLLFTGAAASIIDDEMLARELQNAEHEAALLREEPPNDASEPGCYAQHTKMSSTLPPELHRCSGTFECMCWTGCRSDIISCFAAGICCDQMRMLLLVFPVAMGPPLCTALCMSQPQMSSRAHMKRC